MKKDINIHKMAENMNLKSYIGIKVVAREKHLYRPNEISEIIGWSYDIFNLKPNTKYENYFHLCVRYDEGEIAQIPVNFKEMGYEIIS